MSGGTLSLKSNIGIKECRCLLFKLVYLSSVNTRSRDDGLVTRTMIGRSMDIDVAWGDTSKFAIAITQYRNNKVEVFYAKSFESPQMNEIINHIIRPGKSC